MQSSAGGQGLITNQSPAHVHNVCIIQKQAKHSVYVYTFKTSLAGEVFKVCSFSPSPQYEANTRCWFSNEETAGRLTLTEFLQ